MPDYPILLNLEDRLCVVVGAGAIGLRKVRGLMNAGARVRLIAPEAPTDETLADGIEVLRRPFRAGDLDGSALTFAATDDREVNAAVAEEARRRGIPVNVADAPGEGDFTLPALLRQGEVTVAVSTAGQSPALAALLRDTLHGFVGPEWATALEIASAIRRKRLTEKGGTDYNHVILRRLLDGGLLDLITRQDTAGVDRLLSTLFGEGATLAELGVYFSKVMT
jgi:precorrin-2 dehydrogenase/sirohydrochlorin ferrochelatase